MPKNTIKPALTEGEHSAEKTLEQTTEELFRFPIQVMDRLVDISNHLPTVSSDQYAPELAKNLHKENKFLEEEFTRNGSFMYIPLLKPIGSAEYHRVLRIPPTEAYPIPTYGRVLYYVLVEIVDAPPGDKLPLVDSPLHEEKKKDKTKKKKKKLAVSQDEFELSSSRESSAVVELEDLEDNTQITTKKSDDNQKEPEKKPALPEANEKETATLKDETKDVSANDIKEQSESKSEHKLKKKEKKGKEEKRLSSR